MLRCTLTWTLRNRPLCPACLEVLSDAAFIFRDNVAFCPLCAQPSWDRIRADCLRVLSDCIGPDHVANFRGLEFFTPCRVPRVPVQLVRADGPDAWLLEPGVDAGPPPRKTSFSPIVRVMDDNPPGGGSPI